MQNTISLQIALELCAAFFTALCAIINYISRKDEPKRSASISILLILGLQLLLSDAIAWWYRGMPGAFPRVVLLVSNFIVYATYPLMFIFVCRYLYRLTHSHGHKLDLKWLNVMDTTCGLHLILIIVSQFTGLLYYFDSENIYHRSGNYFLVSIFGVIELVYLMVLILHNMSFLSRYELVALNSFVFMPFATNLIQTFYYGLSLTEFTSSLCMVLFFMFHEVEKSSRLLGQAHQLAEQNAAIAAKEKELAEQEAALALQRQKLDEKEKALNFALAVNEYYKTQLTEKEQALTQANVQLSVSQMRPHFVCNALGSIEQLCRTNPKLAAEATHQFAFYLRNNLIAMNTCELKEFPEELAHIRSYVWLEQMRFGEDLDYQEDIQAEDFQVPVLCIQPLVENSIKHGMMGVEEGTLHVKLKTWEAADAFYVEVSDDGGGFDPTKKPDDGRIHVGLTNVRSHIEHMCGGELRISSIIGKGTVFTVVIPK